MGVGVLVGVGVGVAEGDGIGVALGVGEGMCGDGRGVGDEVQAAGVSGAPKLGLSGVAPADGAQTTAVNCSATVKRTKETALPANHKPIYSTPKNLARKQLRFSALTVTAAWSVVTWSLRFSRNVRTGRIRYGQPGYFFLTLLHLLLLWALPHLLQINMHRSLPGNMFHTLITERSKVHAFEEILS